MMQINFVLKIKIKKMKMKMRMRMRIITKVNSWIIGHRGHLGVRCNSVWYNENVYRLKPGTNFLMLNELNHAQYSFL